MLMTDLSFVPMQKVTKVPLHAGEQRLIIATCEKGTVEDVNDMKDIKAGLDQIKDKHPNFVDIAAHEVFRPRECEAVLPIRSRREAGSKAAKERVALMENRKQAAHRHPARAEYLHLRAAVQCVLREPGRAAGEHRLLRLHDAGALSRRRQPRRDRSLLPGEDRHLARL